MHLLISHSPEAPHEELPQASEPWALGHKGYKDPKPESVFLVCLDAVSGSTPVLSTIVWDPLQPLFSLCSRSWGQRHNPWAPADSCRLLQHRAPGRYNQSLLRHNQRENTSVHALTLTVHPIPQNPLTDRGEGSRHPLHYLHMRREPLSY